MLNTGRKRRPSILKKADSDNLDQCEVNNDYSEEVAKLRRKSKRVSFGQREIREIANVSEITRNWKDSLSSDEGLAGLSDIGNLTSLKNKRSLDIPKMNEFSESKNVTKILSSTKGFKFFDNSALTAADEDINKENEANAAEQGLSAKEFLRSHNFINSDDAAKHTVIYPDVNPPTYNEVMNASQPPQIETITYNDEIKSGQAANHQLHCDMLSAEHIEQTASDDMPESLKHKDLSCMQLNKTNFDSFEMDMTCGVSHHLSRKSIGNDIQEDEQSEHKPRDIAMDRDVSVTVKPFPSTVVANMDDDMEMTCAIKQPSSLLTDSTSMSNFAVAPENENSGFACDVGSHVSAIPAKSSEHESEDMDFTCVVRSSSVDKPASQTVDAMDTDANGVRYDSIRPQVASALSQSLEEDVTCHGDEGMEFTCVLTEKQSDQSVASIEIADIDNQTRDDVFESVVSEVSANLVDSPTPYSECIVGKELDKTEAKLPDYAQVSASAQSNSDHDSSVPEKSTSPVQLTPSTSETVQNQSAAARADSTETVKREFVENSKNTSIAAMNSAMEPSPVIYQQSSVFCKSKSSPEVVDDDRMDFSTTAFPASLPCSDGHNVVEMVQKRSCANNVQKYLDVSEVSCPTITTDILKTKDAIVPVEKIMESFGLAQPEIPWSRDSVATKVHEKLDDMSLAQLFELKFLTPLENKVRESVISQIEKAMGWIEGSIDEMKEEQENYDGLTPHGLSTEFFESEEGQRKLRLLRDSCVSRAKVYWMQTKTKLYKGLTKVLEDYKLTHLEKFCAKYCNVKELLELASEELRKSEKEQRPDRPTAYQENELNRLDEELHRITSEIESNQAKNKIMDEKLDRMKRLTQEVEVLRNQCDELREKKVMRRQKLEDFERRVGRKMFVETENILNLNFLKDTITLSVTLVENLSPWNWDNKVILYSFRFHREKIVIPEAVELFTMLHNWWNTILPTTELAKDYPDLKSFKSLLRLLTDLDEEFKKLISTGNWITQKLACQYSVDSKEGKIDVTFMAPRLRTDGFRITFSFPQFQEDTRPQEILAASLGPTSYTYTPGAKSWKKLQSGHVNDIINSSCSEGLSVRAAVEAILKHCQYESMMFEIP